MNSATKDNLMVPANLILNADVKMKKERVL